MSFAKLFGLTALPSLLTLPALSTTAGVQFVNPFNHPNFAQPVGDIANPSFGAVQRTLSTPASVLGSFLDGHASPGPIQSKAELSFRNPQASTEFVGPELV